MEFEVVNNQGSSLSVASPTVIKVVGCGGGGSNAVNRMIEAEIKNVEFIALNTDLQALSTSVAPNKLAIGQKLTQGLGAGGDPSIGEKAAEEDKEAIQNILKGANMVFVTAGLGGGTGTGSAPVVARIAKEIGALAVGIVTTPFDWEGDMRMNLAKEGLKKLKESVDSVIVIPNSKICEVFDGQAKQMGFRQQYLAADDLLRQSIEGMSTIITEYGTPNIDFADVRAAMKGQGTALFGIGKASGQNRSTEAATRAINNPLLEDTKIDGAKHFLVNVRASSDFSLNELKEISNIVSASAAPGFDLKPGIVLDESMGDEISVTVIATGFDEGGKTEVVISQMEEAAVSQPVQDRNTVSFDEFDSLLNPGKTNSETPELFTSRDFAQPEQIDSMPKNVEPAAYSSGFGSPRGRFNSGFAPSNSNNVDRNDINTPACMRKNGLSKSINFPPRNE